MSKASIIEQLEKGYANSLFLLKIQIAWALSIVYSQTNQAAKKQEMEKYIRENAPYCVPLHSEFS